MIETRDIVYYVISSIGILVTATFSFFIVRFTKQSAKASGESAKAVRASVELTEQLTKMQEKRDRERALRYATLLTGEICHNYRIYQQPDSQGNSLQTLLETDKALSSYGYTRSSHPIVMTEWDDNKQHIIAMDPLLGQHLGRVYKRFEILIRHSNIDQIDTKEFKGFSSDVDKLLEEITKE